MNLIERYIDLQRTRKSIEGEEEITQSVEGAEKIRKSVEGEEEIENAQTPRIKPKNYATKDPRPPPANKRTKLPKVSSL